LYLCKKLYQYNYNTMKYYYPIAFVFLLICTGTICGQNAIWLFPESPTDTSIVREWTEGKYLVYSSSGSTRKVTLHNGSSPTAISVQLPSIVHINDFRIANDTAFAGGYFINGGTKVGLLACMDIDEMESGSGTFQSMTFYYSPMNSDCCAVNNDDLVTEVKRIALFKDGGLTRIAYIANNNIVDGSHTIVNLKRVGFGDAAFRGYPTNSWERNAYHYNKDGIEEYTDMACTDNHIVVAARDTVNNWFHFMVYIRTADFANLCPLSPPIYYFSDHTVSRQVMVTACDEDKIAAAFNYTDPSDKGVAVRLLDLGSGVPVLTHGVDIPANASASIGIVRDIRFNSQQNCLWFLSEAESPATGLWHPYVFKMDMGNIFAGVYEARYVVDWKSLSLDNFTSGFITSGDGLHAYYEYVWPTASSCGMVELMKGHATSPAVSVFQRHHCPNFPPIRQYSITFTAIEEEAILECTAE